MAMYGRILQSFIKVASLSSLGKILHRSPCYAKPNNPHLLNRVFVTHAPNGLPMDR